MDIWAPGLAVVAFVLFVIIRPHLSTATSVVADKPATPAATAVATARVPLKKIGGTYVVPVEINGSRVLDFTVDSGATDVTVPLVVFYTLTRTGTIKDTDIIGKKMYVLANGSKMQSATFTLRSLKVGDLPTIFRAQPLRGPSGREPHYRLNRSLSASSRGLWTATRSTSSPLDGR